MARLEPTVLDDFVHGDRARWAVQLIDENDDPLNCSSAKARFSVRAAYPEAAVEDESAALLALSTDTPETGLSWIDQGTGRLEVVLSASFTKTLDQLCYLFDLQITTAAGDPITVAVGTIEPDYSDITRAV